MIIALLALQLVQGGLRPLSAVGPDGFGPSAEDCRDCHGDIYDAWRSSRHARAWTNDAFAVSFAKQPMRWCVYCHAPLDAQARLVGNARRVAPGQAPLADEGVSCAACHFRGGKILTAAPPSAAAEKAHALAVEPRLRGELCAGCHQFNFPDEAAVHVRYTDAPMQNTWAESAGNQSCSDCHLRGHRFPGVELLDVSIDVTRKSRDGIVLELGARGAAHRVPTGDPFRRLVVELCSEPSCAEPLLAPEFGRSFRRRGHAWRLDRDTTLPPTGVVRREVTLADAPAIVYWRLRYKLLAPSTEPLVGERVIELANGVLQPN